MKLPDSKKASNLKWKAANPKKYQDAILRWNRDNPDARMVISARARAKKSGVPFNITRQDIVVPEVCPVLGMKLQSGAGRSATSGGNWDSPSLDRIDPELGYVVGNIMVMSKLANTLKGSATPEQLLKFADWIRRTYE